ncbi:hypothetical protein D3C87_620500 [compost metagenome]
MKLHSFISILFLSFALFSCSNDDEKQAGDSGNIDITASRVKTYSMRYAHDSATPTYSFNYLENGNLDIFNYSNLNDYELVYVNDYEIEYINEEEGNFPNGQPKIFINYQLDSNKRITGIISGILSGRLYKMVFTYNSENYLIKIEEFDDYRHSETGVPDFDYDLYEVNTLEWQNGNLVKWNEIRYNVDGTIYVDIETNFSEFLPENINTIGIKNYGFDYFGKGGIPEDIITNSNINFQVFAGNSLPGKSVRSTSLDNSVQIKNYTYNKDSNGRVLQCDISNETEIIENKLFTYTD